MGDGSNLLPVTMLVLLLSSSIASPQENAETNTQPQSAGVSIGHDSILSVINNNQGVSEEVVKAIQTEAEARSEDQEKLIKATEAQLNLREYEIKHALS